MKPNRVGWVVRTPAVVGQALDNCQYHVISHVITFLHEKPGRPLGILRTIVGDLDQGA